MEVVDQFKFLALLASKLRNQLFSVVIGRMNAHLAGLVLWTFQEQSYQEWQSEHVRAMEFVDDIIGTS